MEFLESEHELKNSTRKDKQAAGKQKDIYLNLKYLVSGQQRWHKLIHAASQIMGIISFSISTNRLTHWQKTHCPYRHVFYLYLSKLAILKWNQLKSQHMGPELTA